MKPVKKSEPVTVQTETHDENGFICPRCRFKLRVYKTKTLTGSVVRERICDRCREKIETEEMVMA